jgi:hypothetical protein
VGREVAMAYVPPAVQRMTIFIRSGIAIALLGLGAIASVVWTGFLAYFIVALIERLAES